MAVRWRRDTRRSPPIGSPCLSADVESLDATTRQLSLYGEDLERGFELRMTAVEKALVDMESRGQAFLDDTLRIGRVFDLMNRSRVQREFEERVIADAPADVERRVSELIDWLVDQDLRQWQALSSRVAQRRQAHGEHMTGDEIGGFHNDRAALLDSVGREAQRVVKTFDRRVEAQALADGARTAVAATAALGASALGLGALVTVVATTAAADVSGILAASVLGAMGMLILPAKRRRARAELEAKITDLRQRLTAALRSEFEAARDRSVHRLTDSIGPYSRFVRAAQTKWTDARTALERWRDQNETAGRVSRLGGKNSPSRPPVTEHGRRPPRCVRPAQRRPCPWRSRCKSCHPSTQCGRWRGPGRHS